MTARDALIRAGIIEPTDTVAQAEVKILGFRALVLAEAADAMDAHCEQYGVFGVGDRLRSMAAAGPVGKGIPARDESTWLAAGDRCPAAHPADPTPCGGPVVVTVLDAGNEGASGCEWHGARLLASLEGGRVYGLPDAPEGAAIRVFRAAGSLRPFEWLRGRS